MNAAANQHDIAIVGGGLIGLCAALALQAPHRKISVIESNSQIQDQSDPAGLNTRAIALSYSSVQIFKALGLWSDIKSLSAPIKTVHVSARRRWGVTRIRAADYGVDALGYVIESQLLGQRLWDKVKQSSLISVVTNATFESVKTGAAVRLNYSAPQGCASLQASLLLIADGAQSKARESLGIKHRTIDYGQSAIITNLRFDKPVLATAYERFTDAGPLAMLPLSHHRYACVWVCRPETARELMTLQDVDFIQSLQQCFGLRLGFIQQMGQRFSFPLQRTEAQSLTQRRCVLIGNAANALHPVAGQGFNLGLRDIATLHEVFTGHSISDLDDRLLSQKLVAYETLRRAEQRRVIRLSDGLVSLFSNDLPLLSQLRAAALAVVDILPGLKSEVALSAMGLARAGNAMLRGRLQ